MWHFHCRQSLTVNHTKHPHGIWHMHFRNHLRRKWKDNKQQAMITPLSIDEMAEWCNSFVLIPKLSGKVNLCLDPARFNQVQCCANTGPERSCAETNSSTSCYTNSGSNSNLNNRLDDGLRPAVNNNEIECSIPGPNTETNANNHSNSNFNNRPDNTPLSSNNEIKYFLPGQAKRVTKKQALK